MRLLSKEELAKAKQNDRAKEVAEGLKISHRVDSLRKLQSEEETALSKFRNESLATITKEIEELSKRKDLLSGEVDGLQAKFDALLPGIPLKRKELKDLEAKLKILEESLDKKSKEIDLKEIDIALAVKEANDSKARQITQEKKAEKLNLSALEKEKEAESALKKAKNTEERAISLEKDMESKLSLRKNALIQKEKSIQALEEENIRKSRDLSQREAQIEDQRKTLERALERIKQNRLA